MHELEHDLVTGKELRKYSRTTQLQRKEVRIPGLNSQAPGGHIWSARDHDSEGPLFGGSAGEMGLSQRGDEAERRLYA